MSEKPTKYIITDNECVHELDKLPHYHFMFSLADLPDEIDEKEILKLISDANKNNEGT